MEINKPIAIIIVLIISLVLIFLFVIPKYQESVALQEKVVQKQKEYNREVVYREKISEALKNVKDRQDVLERINSALPADVSFAPLVYFAQEKASENGLVVGSMTFSPLRIASANVSSSSPDVEVKDIVFTLNLTGGYQGFKNFLRALENSARLFEINNLSFAPLSSSESKAKSPGQTQIYNFRLDVKTHSY